MRKWVSAVLVLAMALALFAIPGAATSAHRFTVVFKSDTLPADAADVVAAAGGQVVAAVPEVGVMAITGPASMLDTLGADPEIQAVSPSLEFTLAPADETEFVEEPEAINSAAADLYNRYQWDIKQMTNYGASWTIDPGSHNTVVGVIDTGISTQHPDLKANFLGGRNFVPAGGFVFAPDATETGDPNDIEDRNGHGSHVAGSIAGNGRILGIGPKLGFRSYRVFGAQGGTPTEAIVKAIIAATNDGVDVITMSIGGYDSMAGYTWTDPETGIVYKGKDVADFRAYERAVRYAIERGVVVVAAAGNEATNTSNPTAVTEYLNAEYGPQGYVFWGAAREVPGTLPGVVCVSATGPDYSLASYSNYGQSSVDICAPGGEYIHGIVTEYCLSAYKNGGYVWMVGTSMATPKTAAVAALIIDQAKANGETLTPAQVVTRLERSAIDIGKTGNDMFFGDGFANAYSALGGK